MLQCDRRLLIDEKKKKQPMIAVTDGTWLFENAWSTGAQKQKQKITAVFYRSLRSIETLFFFSHFCYLKEKVFSFSAAQRVQFFFLHFIIEDLSITIFVKNSYWKIVIEKCKFKKKVIFQQRVSIYRKKKHLFFESKYMRAKNEKKSWNTRNWEKKS